MGARISRFSRIGTLICCFFLAQAARLIGADLVLQKVPPLTVEESPAYPQNVARYRLGAQVEAAPRSNPLANLQLSSKSEDHNIAEAALLCDDPTVGYALPNGTSTLLISLSRIENIGSISFRNDGTKGSVTVATASAKLSADGPQWHKIAQQDLTPNVVEMNIGPSEAKYIKFTFNVDETGRIADLGVYSAPSVSDFTMPRSGKIVQGKSETVALISYNFTDVHSKARALYVSSGEDLKQANNMIDDQPATTYAFATNDASPTAIIDLGKTTNLWRISAVYAAQQGTVDFYVLKALPGAQPGGAIQLSIPGQLPQNSKKNLTLSAGAAPQTLRLSDSVLTDLKPVGSVVDNGTGRAAIDFPSTTGRYVMLRWTPATQQESAFSVTEIAAFGSADTETPSLMVASASLAGGGGAATEGQDAKDFGEGKEGKEVAEAPGEGPPPTLPNSPPFVFVPQILQVSE